MQVNTSENLFFSQRDVFLTMTIFVSLKALFTLRRVCKSFNSWLSDPNSFSWQQRIKAAFPLSYESVLKEDIVEQVQQLRIFDTLIESGHQVSSYLVDSLAYDTQTAKFEGWQHIITPKRFQIPWQRDLLIISKGNNAMLFNVSTRSVVSSITLTAKSDAFRNIHRIIVDIKERKIGFLEMPPQRGADLKLYRIEDNKFIHEQDFVIEGNAVGPYLASSQLYGDTLVFKNDAEQNQFQFVFYDFVNETQLDSTMYTAIVYRTLVSSIEPYIYLTLCDNERIIIQRIDCINSFTEEETYRAKDEIYSAESPIGCVDEIDVELVENGNDKFIRICLSNGGQFAVQIIDLQKRKLILNQSYSEDISDEPNRPKKVISYFYDAWDNLKYNSGTPYYSTTSHGVVTVADINNPFNDYIMDDTMELDLREDEVMKLPDTSAIFSKYYEGYSVMDSKWLNNDILTFKLRPDVKYKYRGTDLNSGVFDRITHKQVLFSVAKRDIIGYINEKIDEIFVSQNTIFCFTKRNGVYVIKLYLQQNDSKKRKLEADLTSDEHRSKKIKLEVM